MHFRDWRINAVLISFIIIGGAIIAQLFLLQIVRYDNYSLLAQDQYHFFQQLFPLRGEIFLQDYKTHQLIPFAINKEFKQVYAVPQLIPKDNIENLATQLSQALALDRELILQRINKTDDPYEPLKHQVDDLAAQNISDLNVNGIKLSPEMNRYYPGQTLGCHLLGFMGIKNDLKIGQYGLEGYYENTLKGQLGSLVGEKDTAGRWIPTIKQNLKPAENGPKLVLTIDQNIQFKVEKELKQAMEQWQAAAGTIIVLNPQTSAVYALANYPNYDPNQYANVDNIDIFLDPAIQKVYEPGSVFKAITMAAGLDSEKVSANQTFIDTGTLVLKGGTIKNANDAVYGLQDMSQVLEKSINTGAVFVQQKTGQETFREYVQDFGFGSQTGIDLSGEISGDIMNLLINREINFATASFGQGISVTPLQLVNAMAAITNQGKLMQPFLVEKQIYPDGQENITQPKMIRKVIKDATAQTLTKMLVNVVDNGHGKKAQIAGYNIGGKTGTAEVPNENAPGYSEDTIHTFVGFGPAFKPRFVILVKIDKPIGARWAETTSIPVFKEIAEYLLNYFEIPPDQP